MEREASQLLREAFDKNMIDKDEYPQTALIPDTLPLDARGPGNCRELIAAPHDSGVADGDLVTLDVLKPETRQAYKEIAAAIVDGYR